MKRCLCGIFTVFNNSSICPLCGELVLELFDDVRLRIFRNETGIKEMSDTDLKDLFIKFYNPAKISVAGLSSEELTEHIKQLELICCEAKANLKAADDESRERKAKLSVEQRSWLVTSQNPDQTVSDAIAAVKIRKERMSKGDKLIQSLIDAGLDDDFIAQAKKKVGAAPKLVDKFEFNHDSKPLNPAGTTQETLLADLADSIKSGLDTRPIDDLVKATRTAGHIGNKILGPANLDEVLAAVSEAKPEVKPFNPFAKK